MPPGLGTAEKPSSPATQRAGNDIGEDIGHHDTQHNADDAADDGGGTRLDDKLAADILALGAPGICGCRCSRVRSVTETSMMFIMPMPPTSREIAAITTRMIMSAPTMESIMSIISRGGHRPSNGVRRSW